MDIVIVAQYILDITTMDCLNSRFVYLANMLKEKHSVEIVTSDFIHSRKENVEPVTEFSGINITMLHEPGYKRNISVSRFISHAKLAKRIANYLKHRKTPDIVYCAIPSLDVAYAVAKYCKKNNIKFIIDIQDLWPEAFKMVFKVPIVSDIIFTPLNFKANRVYKWADEIVAVSDTYVERALNVNKKCESGISVFLGTDLDNYDNYKKGTPLFEKKENEVWIGYCGSLSTSYDIPNVIYALKKLNEKGITNFKLIIMGDGAYRSNFECVANMSKVDVVFCGFLPYEKMCAQLNLCDIVVNPIKSNSAASIINKHADYAASGLPVVNTQDSFEYRKLVDEYRMGFNCNNEDPNDMATKLEQLILNENLRSKMGYNARKCAEEKFDRKNSYKKIVELIEK